MPTTRFLALLRGINVGGNNKIPMAELRALSGEIGWKDVQSYIQSGNLIFEAAGTPADLEADLERAIARRFGLSIEVLVRAGAAFPAYVAGNPFLEACGTESNLVMLLLSKAPPRKEAAAELRKRAAGGERIVQVGDALWIHYAGGVARSKLSPALMDRLVGSTVTARNWRTVLKLEEMVGNEATPRDAPRGRSRAS
jgi:uncharacterized protein (DUF1697 family)